MMEGVKDKQNPNPECKECTRKSSLIHKYLHLIELLRKKNEKSDRSTTITSNRNSLIELVSDSQIHEPQSLQSDARLRIAQVLGRIEQTRQSEGFKPLPIRTEAHQLALRVISNRYLKAARILGFQKLKAYTIGNIYSLPLEELLKQQKNQECQSDGRTQNRPFVMIKNNNCSDFKHLDSSSNIALPLETYKKMVSDSKEASLESKVLKQKLKKVQAELQDSLRRQLKQSDKKKQSLQMLAEDITEKNEIISELQCQIRFYESKIDKSDNVLEDEFETMRKDVESLEKINKKYEFDLEKQQNKAAILNERNQQLLSKLTEAEKDTESMRYKAFEFKNVEDNYTSLAKELQMAIDVFTRKMDYLKNVELKLNQKSRQFSSLERLLMKSQTIHGLEFQKIALEMEKPTFESRKLLMKPSTSTTLSEIEGESKSDTLFWFLKNIKNLAAIDSQKKSNFPFRGILNQSESQILEQHLCLFQKNHNISCIVKEAVQERALGQRKKTKVLNKLPKEKTSSSDDSDEIFHREQDEFNSILDVMSEGLKPSRNEIEKQSPNKNEKIPTDLMCTVRREPKQNLTMKLLQLQIEKNGLIQKISELKSRHFHIRNVVLNLLKVLQLSEISIPNRTETLGVLDVIFDVFEYSQEEKEEIFNQKHKKNKFFGFFK